MSEENDKDLERTQELYDFLRGNVPEGYLVDPSHQPKLTDDQAWTVIWYLGNQYWQEKELGPLCVEWLRKCGGVLEHPAHSRLWDECRLPKPGWTHRAIFGSAEVLQAWWGDTRTKTTWLCFFGINPNDVEWPLRLHDPRGDRRRWQVMSHTQRSATIPAMAEWLVNIARRSSVAGRAAGAGVGLRPSPAEEEDNAKSSDESAAKNA